VKNAVVLTWQGFLLQSALKLRVETAASICLLPLRKVVQEVPAAIVPEAAINSFLINL
jgi:hypothetical protein